MPNPYYPHPNRPHAASCPFYGLFLVLFFPSLKKKRFCFSPLIERPVYKDDEDANVNYENIYDNKKHAKPALAKSADRPIRPSKHSLDKKLDGVFTKTCFWGSGELQAMNIEIFL